MTTVGGMSVIRLRELILNAAENVNRILLYNRYVS